VKFLVDAQLPLRLARLLARAGHDTLHTINLQDGNRTPDREVAQRADSDGRIVVTKDRDFRDSHLLSGSPRRLLVVATGNTSNNALLDMVEANLELIVDAFEDADFVEFGPQALIVHRRREDPGPS
jgi:predicted nuclease of predicted toxin-antitoxin system